jgi:hypothetical protein
MLFDVFINDFLWQNNYSKCPHLLMTLKYIETNSVENCAPLQADSGSVQQ